MLLDTLDSWYSVILRIEGCVYGFVCVSWCTTFAVHFLFGSAHKEKTEWTSNGHILFLKAMGEKQIAPRVELCLSEKNVFK